MLKWVQFAKILANVCFLYTLYTMKKIDTKNRWKGLHRNSVRYSKTL